MEVKVKYFGMIAEVIEKEEEFIAISNDQLPIDMKSFFIEKYPELSKMSFQIAIDNELSNQLTGKAETIAILPPFAGG